MLNGDLKKNSLERLKNANDRYQNIVKEATRVSTNLHQLRKNTSKELIQQVENYINSLANSPKEFEKSVSELKISYSKFEAVIREIEEADNAASIAGSTAGAGVLAGAGLAALGPGAAMAIATTFGTASTGTAISALSGAAATNAALAWLGGGALAAGGGGMAAGNAFLALAGPVGLAIGGAAIAGGIFWARKKNQEIAAQADGETLKIEKNIHSLSSSIVEVNVLYNQTLEHTEGAKKQLNRLKENAPSDYKSFDDSLKNELGALINNINSLSKLLIKNVG